MGVLVFGDTETSPTLRHEVPLAIGDPFLYLEAEGRRVVVTNALEDSRIARAAPDLERLLVDAFGRDDLIAEGRSRAEVEREVCVRAIATVGSLRPRCRQSSRWPSPTACAQPVWCWSSTSSCSLTGGGARPRLNWRASAEPPRSRSPSCQCRPDDRIRGNAQVRAPPRGCSLSARWLAAQRLLRADPQRLFQGNPAVSRRTDPRA
jgi:hypothetical protein